MIVLNEEQATWLRNFMTQRSNEYPDYVDAIPVAIKNNLYILPETVLSDWRFEKIKIALGQQLNGIQIREVNESEYIYPTVEWEQ